MLIGVVCCGFRTPSLLGPAMIFHALPFIVVTILSFVVIELRTFIKAKSAELRKLGGGDGSSSLSSSSSSSGSWRTGWRLSTYPVWVDKSPFGILTGAEALGILIILFVTVYYFGRMTDLSFHRIQKSNRTPSAKYIYDHIQHIHIQHMYIYIYNICTRTWELKYVTGTGRRWVTCPSILGEWPCCHSRYCGFPSREARHCFGSPEFLSSRRFATTFGWPSRWWSC